jgi:hypothetical protein
MFEITLIGDAEVSTLKFPQSMRDFQGDDFRMQGAAPIGFPSSSGCQAIP